MKLTEIPTDRKVRFGRMWWNDSCAKFIWMVSIHVEGSPQQQVRLSRDDNEAERLWLEMLVRHGHPPRPEGPTWFWCGQRQAWAEGPGYLPRAERRAAIRAANAAQRQDTERIKIKNDRALSLSYWKIRRRKEDAERKLKAYLKKRRCEAYVPGIVDLEPTTRDLKMVAYRQYVTPMQFHQPSACWYCWVGIRLRKIVMLGNAKPSATRLWLQLRHGLNGGSRILLTALKLRPSHTRGHGKSKQTECVDHL